MAAEWLRGGVCAGYEAGSEDGVCGFCGHPEAAHGGPIALIENGDVITLNAIEGEISVDLTDEVLAERKANWKGPRQTIYASGALWKYSQLVGSAKFGACTHPGARDEKHIYMDL